MAYPSVKRSEMQSSVIELNDIYRQSFLEMKDEVIPNMDYVIIARNQAATLDFHETKKSLQHVLKIAKVIKEEVK